MTLKSIISPHLSFSLWHFFCLSLITMCWQLKFSSYHWPEFFFISSTNQMVPNQDSIDIGYSHKEIYFGCNISVNDVTSSWVCTSQKIFTCPLTFGRAHILFPRNTILQAGHMGSTWVSEYVPDFLHYIPHSDLLITTVAQIAFFI